MRDIIYRGKTKNGEWEYGGIVIYEKDAFIITKEDFSWSIMGDRGDYDGCITPVLPETIGQYTGLLDKDGKKVFEGDIVKVYDNFDYVGETLYVGTVQWDDTFLNWELKTSEKIVWQLKNLPSVLYYEVIGNVFDNPEMLEVK